MSTAQHRQRALETILDTRHLLFTCLTDRCPDNARRTNYIASSTDGKRVALAYDDGHTVVWDLDRTKRLLTLPAMTGNSPMIPEIRLSTRGDRLITVDSGLPDDLVRQWAVPGAPRPLQRYKIPDSLILGVTPDASQVLVSPIGTDVPVAPATMLLMLDRAPGAFVAGASVPAAAGVGPRDTAYLRSRHGFVVAWTGTQGYLLWQPGQRVRAFSRGCAEPLTLSVDGSVFACATRGAPTQLLGTISIWDVRSGRILQHWAPSPTSYGGGRLTDAHITSLALADNGHQVAISTTWKAPDGQHTRITVARTSDHTVISHHDLHPVARFGDVVGADLTTVGSLVVADQVAGQFGHRVYVINAE
jgi:hypothetical protein